MGAPKKPRKKYKTPRHPWRTDQLTRELQLVGTYGLRNKKELWRTQTELSRIRAQARNLLATNPDVRAKKEKELLQSLYAKGLVGENATLDDVLSLTIENLLERRLQTLVWKKGLASTPYQARQFITHGHIKVKEQVVKIPSYFVKREEEGSIRFKEDSPLTNVVITPNKVK